MGIKGIKVGTDQQWLNYDVVKLPEIKIDKNTFPVYGIRRNGERIRFEALLDNVEESQIKWFYTHLDDLIITGRYIDDNEDDYYSRNPEISDKFEVKEIMSFANNGSNKGLKNKNNRDPYEIGNKYKTSKSIDLLFPKETDLLAQKMFWVEPFLDYPEFCENKNFGFFVTVIDYPGIFEVNADVSGGFGLSRIELEKAITAAKSNNKMISYGDTIGISFNTFMVPDNKNIDFKIKYINDKKGNNEEILVYKKSIKRQKEKEKYRIYIGGEISNYVQKELVSSNIAYEEVVFNIDFKPKEHEKGEKGIYKIELNYPYSPLDEIMPDSEELINAKRRNREKKEKEIEKIQEKGERSTIHISKEQRELDKKEQQIKMFYESKETNHILNRMMADPYIAYFSVMNGGKKEMLLKRMERVNKMVEVKTEPLIAPGNNPCHYTKILAGIYKGNTYQNKLSECPDDIIVFDENNIKERREQPIIEVIAGNDKYPSYLKLEADIDINNQCRSHKHEKEEEVFYFHKKLNTEDQNIAKYKIENKSISLELPYMYINDGTVPFPLNYLWFERSDIQPYSVMIETCRYRNDILINVYPDIYWYIMFEYSCKNPIKYSNNSVANRAQKKDILKIARDKNKEEGKLNAVAVSSNKKKNEAIKKDDQSAEYGNIETKFKLGIGCAWNKGLAKVTNDYHDKIEYSTEIEQKIASFLQIFIDIRKAVNFFFTEKSDGSEISNLSGNDKRKTIETAKKIGKTGRDAVILEVLSPSISFECGFKYENIKDNKVARKLQTVFSLNPIIGGKGTLDLIALASKIPKIGTIVRIVDGVLGILGIEPTFTVSFVGSISFKGNFDAYHHSNGKVIPSAKSSIDLSGRFGMEVELSAKGEWKVKQWILVGKTKHVIKASASAKTTSYFIPRMTLSSDDKGMFLEGNINFSGIYIELEINVEVHGDNTKKILKRIPIIEKPEEPVFKTDKYYIFT